MLKVEPTSLKFMKWVSNFLKEYLFNLSIIIMNNTNNCKNILSSLENSHVKEKNS